MSIHQLTKAVSVSTNPKAGPHKFQVCDKFAMDADKEIVCEMDSFVAAKDYVRQLMEFHSGWYMITRGKYVKPSYDRK